MLPENDGSTDLAFVTTTTYRGTTNSVYLYRNTSTGDIAAASYNAENGVPSRAYVFHVYQVTSTAEYTQ